ncbi:hypothetical protein ACTXGJ_01330 [Psychrobacter sp. 1Y11]|uniref:hypothetical protein n=1 Tax=Psychrobacter sp. 1Y11 TaxID=3457446 RepID=UPI003FD2BE05
MSKLSNSLSLIITAAISLVIVGCQSATNSQNSSAQHNAAINTPVIHNQNSTSAPAQTLEQQALRIQQALANGSYASIKNDIHPIRGVRFSMYAYVRPESDKSFSRTQFAQYLQKSDIRFTWGEKDGTGDPLITTLPDYLQTWVNAEVFDENATMTVNDSQATGNSIDNLSKIYQNADYVEFYKDGSEQYGGMDWRAMRLVFDEYQGKRYLVAIISDQWTV